MAYTYLMSILLQDCCDLLSDLMVACLLHVNPNSSLASGVHHYKCLLFFEKCVHAANMSFQFKMQFVVRLAIRLMTLRQSVLATQGTHTCLQHKSVPLSVLLCL